MTVESDNRKAEQVRKAAIVLEPSIQFANLLLDVTRDTRKRLGRGAGAVWMPPAACAITILTAELPPRALDEVIGMGMSLVASGFRDVQCCIGPPSLERLADGSMLIISRAWSTDSVIGVISGALARELERVGVESVDLVSGGLKLVYGWMPGASDIASIPGAASFEYPSRIAISGLVGGILEPVGTTPMTLCRRVRTAPLAIAAGSRHVRDSGGVQEV